MHRLVVLACLASCGRFGFDAATTGDSGASRDAAVDARSTGPTGPRWLAAFTDNGFSSAIGRDGDVALIARFVGSFVADGGVNLTGNGFLTTAFVRWDALGKVTYSTALDANGFCDLRKITLDGDVAYLAGYTQGTVSIPAYGACSIVTNRQDPIAIQIDPQANQTLVAHWAAGGANAQAFGVTALPDHSLALSGIYGDALTIGSYVMPSAIVDPSFWTARTDTTVTGATWARGFTAATDVIGGQIASDGDDVCLLGAYKGNVTLFGAVLPYVGGYDSFVARLDPSGTERWVRGFGSPGDESAFGEGNVLGVGGGECLVAVQAAGDVTLDGTTYPAADGAGLLVRFAADGAIASARRFPGQPFVTQVGSRFVAAYSNTSGDVEIVELDPQGGANMMLGTLAGAGKQAVVDLAAVGPDAVAITVTNTGALTFGSLGLDSGTTMSRVIGVLGI